MTFEKNREAFAEAFAQSRNVKWIILAAVTLIFTLLLYPNLVMPQLSYNLGDVAERDIKAPKDFFVEDTEATEAKKKAAVQEILTVYDYDETLLPKIVSRVTDAFAEMRALYDDETDGASSGPPSDAHAAARSDTAPSALTIHEKVWQKRESFQEKLGVTLSNSEFKLLEKTGFPAETAGLIVRILTEILENGVVANKEILLKEVDKGVLLRTVGKKTERPVGQLKRYYGLAQAKTMVRVIGQPLLVDMNHAMRTLVVDVSQKLIQPNITLNRNETIERRKRAAREVKPVLYKIKAGEMLLREGERVTPLQLLKLKALQGQIREKQMVASSIGVAAIVVCLLTITYMVQSSLQGEVRHSHNKDLLFMASVVVIVLLVAKVMGSLPPSMFESSQLALSPASLHYGIPIATGTMIICIFLGIDIAITTAMVIALLTAVLFHNRLEMFIYFLLNGVMAAYWTRNCRERKVFIKAGLKLGCLNVVLATALGFYMADISGVKLLWDWLFGFLGGLITGVAAAGLVPLVELTFDYTTDIKLLELANLDQPILRRLMLEAPGTYHHSVIVGSMVEAAAREIGANPLLAKVCGYYHDIGKINKPLYFIENQTDGKNKHDKLAPSMSKRILVAHVKDGVTIARQHKLGKAIVETIKQSHGTSVISYFYEKAKQLKGEQAVKIDDYRYPGPKPQTREAGLVMLADVVEAASRTLSNPTPARIQGLVQKLINNVFSDGQLGNCELTLKDLHEIAKSFNTILNGIYHHRVEYTETPYVVNGKDKNGGSDRQPARPAQDRSERSSPKSGGHLRRLGLS